MATSTRRAGRTAPAPIALAGSSLAAFLLCASLSAIAPPACGQDLIQPETFRLVSDEAEPPAAAPLGARTPIARAIEAHWQEPAEEPPAAPPATAGELPLLPDTRIIGTEFPTTPLSDDLLLSPNRVPVAAGESGSSTTLLTEREIRRTQQVILSDVLRGQPGVDVVQQGPKGGITSIFLRGTNGQQTKVLVDGIPINDPSNAGRSFDFSSLTVDNIERVEILRGPQSVLYGSDAIGGVVNIITKRGEGPITTRLGLLGGSFGTSHESFQTSGGNDLVYFSLGGSWTNSNGFSASNTPGNPEADGYQNGALSARVGFTPSPGFNVDYVFRWSDVHSQIDDTIFPNPLPVDNLFRQNISRQQYQRVQVQSLALEGAIDQRVGFNYTYYHRKDTDPGLFFPSFFNGETQSVDYLANLLLYDGHLLSLGAMYYDESAENDFDPFVSQTQASVFVQDQLRLTERWNATFGARWDDNSRAGPASTYRATTNYTLAETGTRWFATLGTGFRAPSLAENLSTFGNPNLRPETSKGWDFGFEQRVTDDFSFGATYFRNDLTNLIVFNTVTFQLENVGLARTSGVETFARWQMTDTLALQANYTFTDAINLDTGDQLVRRPRDKAGLNFIWNGLEGRAQANLYVVYVGTRPDSSSFVLDPYILVNAAGSYNLTERCQLVGRLDNLCNVQYEEVAGYATAGLSGYAGLNFIY